MDFDHTLSNARNYQGTLAGLGNAGNNVNAFGAGAAQGNTASSINALGIQAALSNTGSNVNALGADAATSNSGNHTNAFGSSAALSNSGFYVNALGRDAGNLNPHSYVNLFGYNASATTNNQTVLAGQTYSARLSYNGLTADRLYTFPDKSGTFAMLSDLAGGGWSTTGNAGTNASVNFIGTTDNVDLVFKRNNLELMRLSQYQALYNTNITSYQGFSTYITATDSTFNKNILDITSGLYISKDPCVESFNQDANPYHSGFVLISCILE